MGMMLLIFSKKTYGNSTRGAPIIEGSLHLLFQNLATFSTFVLH